MIALRRSGDRGRTRLDWLDSRHTFSFGDYRDPQHRGFRALRVINEDWIAPQMGFGMHPHRDMEIVTVVLAGALEHRDSLGNGSLIRPGEVQRMTAGTGILHSEFNASETEPVHLLQIWLHPEQNGLPPGYQQKVISDPGALRLLAAREPDEHAVTIHQDVRLFQLKLPPAQSVTYELAPGRHAWLQVTRGHVTVNGEEMSPGDGAAVSEATRLALATATGATSLLFDLA